MSLTGIDTRSSKVSATTRRLASRRCAATLTLGLVALALPRAAAGDGEIGPELLLSDMGTPGNLFTAQFPQVAYNPIDHEFLVVWQGDDNAGGSVDQEIEIFGQRIDAATGLEVGPNDFRISDMGGDNLVYGAAAPRVVFNATAQEYLVVWHGDDDAGGLVDDEWEVFGQRLDAAGNPVGPDDFRISHAGGTGATTYEAKWPAAAWNSTANEYLVVWAGDDTAVADGEIEVFGQRLDAAGNEIGDDDFRITALGAEGSDWQIVYSVDVAYNPQADEYLVVCDAEDDQGGMVEGEIEIFAQRPAGATGAEVGADDLRVSDAGDSGSSVFAARFPRVAYLPGVEEYLVVWTGDDNVGGLVDGEHEVFGQRLDGGNGAEIGANDFRISALGGTGNVDLGATRAAVAAHPDAGGYLVVWGGFAAGRGLGLDVYGQYLAGDASPLGTDDELLSDDAGGSRDALLPAVACADGSDRHLVVWHGDQDPAQLGEHEVFGQRMAGRPPLFADGFESGDLSRWSATTP